MTPTRARRTLSVAAAVVVATLLLPAALAQVGPKPAAGKRPKPEDSQVSSKRDHDIPLEWKEAMRSTVDRIELAVSTDKGDTYSVVDAAGPDRASLRFRAPSDGVYWLMTVIHSKNGKRSPASIIGADPELELLIDTAPPVVRIAEATRAGDEVTVRWAVEDRYPDDSATQVLYRAESAPVTDWTPVPPSQIRSGVATFKPGTAGPVVVQVTAQDMAKNRGSAAKAVAGTDAGAAVAAGYTPAPSLPAAVPVPVAAPPVTPLPAGPVVPVVVPVAAAEPYLAPPTAPALPAPAPKPPELPPPTPVAPMNSAPPAPPANVPPPAVSGQGTGQPAAPSWMPPPAAGGFAPGPAPAPSAPSATAAPAPPANPAKILNATQFDLNFQVGEVGPSGLSRIDLYVTRDDGRTWVRWSQHPPSPSEQQSLRAVLDGSFNQRNPQPEGDYGFRLVPVSGAGLSEGAPTPGTAPDLKVRIDTTPPVIQGYAPEPDATQATAMILRYSVTDVNKSDTPITIEWSEQPAGPWTLIPNNGPPPTSAPAAGGATTDSGSLVWQLPPNFPVHRVYLRYSAVDAAGNRTVVASRQPFLVDPHKPKARIQGLSAGVAPVAAPTGMPTGGGVPGSTVSFPPPVPGYGVPPR